MIEERIDNDLDDLKYEHASQEILPYGYSILDYARKYDEAFKLLVQHLFSTFFSKQRDILKLVKPNYFPAETVFHIFTYLDHKTLLQAACVSKLWVILSEKSDLWDTLLLQTFSLSLGSMKYICLHQSEDVDLGQNKDYSNIFRNDPPSRAIFKKMTRSFRSLVNNEHLMGLV